MYISKIQSYPSVHPSIYIHQNIYLLIHQSLYISVSLSPFIHPSVHISIYLSIYLSIHLSVCSSIHLFYYYHVSIFTLPSTREGTITSLGRLLVEYPLSPGLARAVIYSGAYGCSQLMIPIAAMLSVENAFIRPGNYRLSQKNFQSDFQHQ